MSLQEKLDAYRTQAEMKRSPEVTAVMLRATAQLAASGQAGRALGVGALAPAFTLPAQDGAPVSSRDLLAAGALVVSFYRGVWCPYCNMDLQALQTALPEITAAGGSLVAISPQTAANSRKAARQDHLTFPILTDHGNEVAAAFGIRFRLPDELIAAYKGFGNDLAMVNGEPSWTLPMPARFVIAPDGTVVYAEVDPDYTRRPDPETLLPALHRVMQRTAA